MRALARKIQIERVNFMKDVFEKDKISMPAPEERRESVRGKLQYYQELIHQNEQRKREEGELDEDIEEPQISN